MAQYVLSITSTELNKTIALTHNQTIAAQQGATFVLLEQDATQSAKNLVMKRQGEDLSLEVDGEEIVVIEHFYADGMGATLSVDGSLTPAEGMLVSSADTTESGVVWQAESTSEQAGLLADNSDDYSTTAWLGAGIVGIGAGTLVFHNSDDSNIVNGQVVAGPVIPGHGLSVVIYQADGVTELGRGEINDDGTYSVNIGNYNGVIVAKIKDKDNGADYLDESTNTNKDLNAELISVGVVEVSTLALSTNALTTVAYHTAIDTAAGNPLEVSVVNDSNTAIAEAFGLTDLLGTAVVPTNGGDHDASDGLTQGEWYGTVLAALSGADQNNASDSQQTIDNLVAGISVTGSTATLDAATQEEVIAGSNIANVNTDNETSTMIDTFAPVFSSGATAAAIDENTSAGQVIYTAAATDSSGITYRLKPGSDIGLTIDESTGVVTLTGSPDHEIKASYSFTVVVTDTAANASEQAVSININDLDEVVPTAPVIDVVATDNIINSTEQTATLTGSAEAGATVALTLGGNVRIITANDMGDGIGDGIGIWNYTLVAADLTAMGEGAETLSATATDAAGNTSSTTTHAITVDTLAPTAPVIDVVATDNIINSAEQTATLTGSAEAGATVALTLGGNVRILTADGMGDWSYTLVAADLTAMGEGAATLTATATDAAGNTSSATTHAITVDTVESVNTSIVVFDLVGGTSSNHSDRIFDSGTSYTIYIKVDSMHYRLLTNENSGTGTWGTWSAGGLGSDDRIIFVGTGMPIMADPMNSVTRATEGVTYIGLSAANSWAISLNSINIRRQIAGGRQGSVIIFDGAFDLRLDSGAGSDLFTHTMPVGIMTSQGLV